MKLIDKAALVAEINRVLNSYDPNEITSGRYALVSLRNFIDTLEVIDPYEQCIQYDSIKAGIQAHAETYSFNIESELFNQLTKEQQVLWRKEIEQACISGDDMGYSLAKDTRYKENLEVKEVDFEKEIKEEYLKHRCYGGRDNMLVILNEPQFNKIAKHFFELGISVSNKAQKGEEA